MVRFVKTVCTTLAVLFLLSPHVTRADQGADSAAAEARVTAQGVMGRFADGLYSGTSDFGDGRVELEFRVRDHRISGLTFQQLRHQKRDFLRDHHDPWVHGVFLQYQAAIDHLEGRPLPAVYGLLNVYQLIGPHYELLETCSSVDGASAATIRGSAVMEAILNGLQDPPISGR